MHEKSAPTLENKTLEYNVILTQVCVCKRTLVKDVSKYSNSCRVHTSGLFVRVACGVCICSVDDNPTDMHSVTSVSREVNA